MARTLALVTIVALAGCSTAKSLQAAASRDVTIPSRGAEVPATWVVPAHAPGEALPLVILIHGHGGTRHEAGGFTRLAARLADAGYASIRMDFPGCGDSTEPFYNNNLTNMLADIRAARDWAMDHVTIDADRVGVVGFSMGARLAALLAASDGGVDTMVLWAPAVGNGAARMVDYVGGPDAWARMKATAARDGWAPFTTFWGQDQQLGAGWFRDMETSRPMDALAGYDGALLIVHGTADDVVPPEVGDAALAAAVLAESKALVRIDGADHGFGLFSDPDPYSELLIAETTTFIAAKL